MVGWRESLDSTEPTYQQLMAAGGILVALIGIFLCVQNKRRKRGFPKLPLTTKLEGGHSMPSSTRNDDIPQSSPRNNSVIDDSESTSSSENPHYEFASSIHSDCETLNEPTKAITHGPFKSKRSLVAARSGPLTSDDTVGALGTTANIYNHDYDNGLDINENLYETENLVAQLNSEMGVIVEASKIVSLEDPRQGEYGQKYAGRLQPLDDTKTMIKRALVYDAPVDTKSALVILQLAAMLRKMDHANVVACLAIASTASCILVAFDLSNDITLQQYFSSQPPFEGKSYHLLNDVILGLAYCHDIHILHTDLRSEHVYISNGVAKLFDFGFGKRICSSDGSLSIRWTAPEVLPSEKYTPESDIYSFGMVLLEASLEGKLPFHDKLWSSDEILKHVRNGYRPGKPNALPQHVYDVCLACWSSDPTVRPKASQIAQLISSTWSMTSRDYPNTFQSLFKYRHDITVVNNSFPNSKWKGRVNNLSRSSTDVFQRTRPSISSIDSTYYTTLYKVNVPSFSEAKTRSSGDQLEWDDSINIVELPRALKQQVCATVLIARNESIVPSSRPAAPNMNKLRNMRPPIPQIPPDWLHGSLSREDAEHIVSAFSGDGKIRGSFLVRIRNGSNSFALTVLNMQGIIEHFLLDYDPHQGWYLNGNLKVSCGFTSDDIAEVISKLRDKDGVWSLPLHLPIPHSSANTANGLLHARSNVHLMKKTAV